MAPRTCPNCGVAESRWTADGREHVNLDPITGNCVDCLRELAKETRATAPASLPFDVRAAAANDRSEA
jgi:hypothetical protein